MTSDIVPFYSLSVSTGDGDDVHSDVMHVLEPWGVGGEGAEGDLRCARS